jgi:serine/threonine-protein kinase
VQQIYVTIRPLNREDSVLYFPPESFGPFRVLHQIGAGALGPVFRAYEPGDKNRDRLVAVKVFRLPLSAEHAEALVTELNVVARAGINHPNIAAPIAAGLEHGVPFLAQQYAIGDPLDVVLREHAPMPIERALPFIEKMAAAIDHASDRGVHHGALQVRDIMVSADSVRLTGFGIAGAVAKAGVKPPPGVEYSTRDERSDVYALAAIAIEMLTGQRVSPESLAEIERRHGIETRRAFDVALDANPDTRMKRATDFAAALIEAPSVAAPGRAAPPGPDPDPLNSYIDLGTVFTESEKQQSRRWPIVAVFLAIGVLTAVSVAYFVRPAPATVREAKAGVAETTVELPASPPVAPPLPSTEPQTAPSREAARPRLPAPAPSRAASGAVSPRTSRGSLLIRSTPGDAEIVLNGRVSGKTPLVLRDLALGSYTIRIAREGYAADERTLQITAARPSAATTFTLRPSNNARVTAGAQGTGALNVQSRPAGARVFVNERLAGATPIAVPDIPAGRATVRIELDGYRPWITTVRVAGGDETRVAASLERN